MKMKKESIFRTLCFAVLCALFIPFVGCEEEPNGPGNGESSIVCNKFNSNLASLQEIVKNSTDYVTSIVPLTENGTQVGFTINLAKSNPVIIYTGLDGKIPAISVKKEDKKYYWTLNGEWLTDDQGNKYLVSEYLPKTNDSNDEWFLSWNDNDANWTKIGVASSESKINVAQNELWVLVSFNGETISLGKNANVACSFTIVTTEITSSSAVVNVIPSDNDIYYYWNVYSTDYTEEMIKEELQEEVDREVGLGYTAAGYWKKACVQGATAMKFSNLTPETTFNVAVVAIDMTTCEFAGEFIWSEFTTTERSQNDKISITLKCENYFDGDEIYEVGNNAGYAYLKGMGYGYFVAVTDGAPAHYYWALSEIGDDFAYVTDDQIINTLLDPVPYSIKRDKDEGYYTVKWAPQKYALIGVAVDETGEFSEVYREILTFDPAGASDIYLLFPDAKKDESAAPEFELPRFNPEKPFLFTLPFVK